MPLRPGHDSCIGTPRKPASPLWKGLVRHHGLDLVDRLGVPDGRLRRHASRCVGRDGAQGEGTGLDIPNEIHGRVFEVHGRLLPRGPVVQRWRKPLRCPLPMSKNEGFVPNGHGHLMADITTTVDACTAGSAIESAI